MSGLVIGFHRAGMSFQEREGMENRAGDHEGIRSRTARPSSSSCLWVEDLNLRPPDSEKLSP